MSHYARHHTVAEVTIRFLVQSATGSCTVWLIVWSKCQTALSELAALQMTWSILHISDNNHPSPTGTSCLIQPAAHCTSFVLFIVSKEREDTDSRADSLVPAQSQLLWQQTDRQLIQCTVITITITLQSSYGWLCWSSSSVYLLLSLDNLKTCEI